MCFSDHSGDKVDEVFVVDMGMLKGIDVFPPRDGGDDGDGIVLLEQEKVHEEPGRAAVAVDEGVDEDKVQVGQGGRLNGVMFFPECVDSGDEFFPQGC